LGGDPLPCGGGVITIDAQDNDPTCATALCDIGKVRVAIHGARRQC
jgi:hypothetical protein